MTDTNTDQQRPDYLKLTNCHRDNVCNCFTLSRDGSCVECDSDAPHCECGDCGECDYCLDNEF